MERLQTLVVRSRTEIYNYAQACLRGVVRGKAMQRNAIKDWLCTILELVPIVKEFHHDMMVWRDDMPEQRQTM